MTELATWACVFYPN